MTLQAVLFDLDDTLTDRTRSLGRVATNFWDEYGPFQLGLDRFQQALREADEGGYTSRAQMFERLIAGLSWRNPPSTEKLVTWWRLNFPPSSVPREGLTDLLRNLSSRGLRLGVVTNGGSAVQRAKLNSIGVAGFFDAVIIDDEVGVSKPDPMIFQLALTQLRSSSSATLFVGDNPRLDVAGAHDFGMRAVWLRTNDQQWPQDVPRCGEQCVDFDDLLVFIDGVSA